MQTSTIIIFALLITNLVSWFYAIRFGMLLLRVEDSIEESLDTLDERYRSISKILEIPLFYDSPQVQQVVSDIKAARDSILRVAQSFAKVDESLVEEQFVEDTNA